MKVLMLGWEFPPHISGGLGTACAGLTQALEKQQVDILFVVPKLHGDERAEHTSFINASSIPIKQKKLFLKDGQVDPSSASRIHARTNVNERTVQQAGMSTIEVPSFLSPYSHSSVEVSYALEQWNYSFTLREERTLPANLRPKHPGERGGQVRFVTEPYQFSGTYGPRLLEEVDRYAQATTEIARQNTFDIIHAHDWMTYKAGLEAKRVSGKPLIVHVHATEIDRSGVNINNGVYEIEKHGMLQADKVVAVSQWTKDIAVKHYKIPAGKIEVVHNGINPKPVCASAASPPPVGSQIVTFLGRITHQKGPLNFVEAARRVHQQFPDAHFLVAGSGDQLPMMIERIAQLRLSSRFHFTGFLKGDEVDRIWSMSSVYVMPSVSEPFGIAPLEAIQAGVPVILSKQAGVSEVMPHAIKVDFWDTEAFADAISNVLRFKSLANTLRKNGADEVRNVNWEKAAKKLTTLYHELSSKNEKPQRLNALLSNTSAHQTEKAALL